jgi:hypothetical protein
MTLVQIGVLVVAAVAFVVAQWAHAKIMRQAGSDRRWVRFPFSKRIAADYPEYPIWEAAGRVLILCLIVLGVMALL